MRAKTPLAVALWVGLLSGIPAVPVFDEKSTLSDSHSVVQIAPSSSSGMYGWTVAGVNQLH
jgi:hypothetical protein